MVTQLASGNGNGEVAHIQQEPSFDNQNAEEARLLALGERNGLIGKSPAWLKVLQKIEVISRWRDVIVLLHGKTGTGKELVARSIHCENEKCSQGRFVGVNCATMGDIACSALFGSRRGAYTNAVDNREGLFQTAQDGTLLLDDVETLSADTQAMLLRALQERKILPVGGNTEISIKNVRVIATTNKDLAAMVRSGCFRQDLYFRLNVVQIHLPSLRERTEDIPLLARSFLSKYASRYDSAVQDFAPAVLEMFAYWPWFGNVRELESVVISSVINKKEGTVLQIEDISREVVEGLTELNHETDDQTIEGVVRAHIQRTLEKTSGDLEEAARILRLGRSTLYRKVKKWGLLSREP